MVTFGSTPGIQVSTASGVVGGVTLGRRQFTVLIGVGDNNAGSATPNTVVDIASRADADDKFGAGTDIAQAYRNALETGSDRRFVRAVMADTTQTNESFTGAATGTLVNFPIIRDSDRISVTDTADGSELVVEYDYASPPSAPSEEDEVRINPLTGELALASSKDIDVTYEFADYPSVISAASDSLAEGEFGLIVPLTLAIDDFQTELIDMLDEMRKEFRFGLVLAPARPTGSSIDYRPRIDPASYTQPFDDDRVFIAGPVAQEGTAQRDALLDIGALGFVAGRLAGSALDDPIFFDQVNNAGRLDQRISRSEANDLRDAGIIPLRDTGVIRINGNRSTYEMEEDEWERDYFTRRVVDATVGLVQTIGDRALGEINDVDSRAELNSDLTLELKQLASDGLLVNDGQFVDVLDTGKRSVEVEIGITPFGVTKQITTTITIDA